MKSMHALWTWSLQLDILEIIKSGVVIDSVCVIKLGIEKLLWMY